MDGGRIVEEGPPERIFKAPAHERTRTFLRQILER
jgi:polar amino acid transport system ATP-binding protein